MNDPLLVGPGTQRPRAEIEQLRHRMRLLVTQDPDNVAARGALDAARWTLREVDDAPLTPGRSLDLRGLEAERDLARSISLGTWPGDRERASGVRAWLEWWLVVSAFPAWLAPTR